MKTVAFSILGTSLDRRGKGDDRWNRWRPTISLCQQDDLIVDRLELIFDNHSKRLADQVTEDIEIVSPETEVVHRTINFLQPWDFESVYSELLDLARGYTFKTSKENYLVHITTGTHVAQICWYLLTEARYIPAKLVQTSPAKKEDKSIGQYQIIDLDLSKYDQIASRFRKEHEEGANYLKSGIQTANPEFNKMIAQLEKVSIRSEEPILITGPTGAGKSHLAKKVFELRKKLSNLEGKFIAINCATLKGENAMSALFGHKKGSFTGASTDRQGLLREANNGLLFLDEIGELGLDEQAMLLRAIEDKRFMPFGSDSEVSSNFQLIAGTNKDLTESVLGGAFREDLLARIDLWTYRLPSLKERPEDFEPNIEFELERFSNKAGYLTRFNKSAKARYLEFSRSAEALWSANFRDLNSSITRMGTLAEGGRITLDVVEEEIVRLKQKWIGTKSEQTNTSILQKVLPQEILESLDLYEQVSLALVVNTCAASNSMAEAGRKLFNVSRLEKKSSNDSHRVRQILQKFELDFDDCKWGLGRQDDTNLKISL